MKFFNPKWLLITSDAPVVSCYMVLAFPVEGFQVLFVGTGQLACVRTGSRSLVLDKASMHDPSLILSVYV